MRQGIEKEKILGMLTDMAHNLDVTETNLQSSLVAHREEICQDHSMHIEEINILFDDMEERLSKLEVGTHAMNEASSLKLELSF